MQGELVIAGDFNAKAPYWGKARSNSRGQSTMTTLRRPGHRETIMDISLASQRLAAQIEDLQVIEVYTGSDHMYITFCVRDGRIAPIPRKCAPPPWNIDKMNPERISLAIAHGQRTLKDIPKALPLPARAKMVTDATMKVIEQAYAEVMTSKHQVGQDVLPTVGGTGSRTFVIRACNYAAERRESKDAIKTRPPWPKHTGRPRKPSKGP